MKIHHWAQGVRDYVFRFFRGPREHLDWIMVAALNRSHVLLEDVPGVGKTLLALAFSKALGLDFRRIQCTPDLTPGDIIGFSVYNPKTGDFVFRKGPVQTSVLLVDEINRATPRSQSALLEAMAEGQVSMDGESRALPDPFILIATENPIEFEGTFPLPEAQKDRFFLSFKLGYPSREEEMSILQENKNPLQLLKEAEPSSLPLLYQSFDQELKSIHMDSSIMDYIMDVVESTRNRSGISLGVSPRGGRALVWGTRALAAIRGRDFVIPDDVKELCLPVFRKRIILKHSTLLKGMRSDRILREILEDLKTPALRE